MAKKRTRKTTPAPAGRKKAPSRTRRSKREQTAPPEPPPTSDGVITIRKYANRRLYDTAASAHITQEDLYRMVSRGNAVRILDATSGEDITNQTLALALIEHDPAKLRLMPTWLLHQMIRLHEQAIGGWLSALWQPLAAAAPISGWPAAPGAWPNPAQAINLGPWSPRAGHENPPADARPDSPQSPARDPSPREESIDELRREVARLLNRLGKLERPGKSP